MKNNLTQSALCAALLSALCAPAFASNNLDHLQNLSQSEFSLLAKDFTAAASYKAVAPGAPLGITGFDIGAELSVTQLENAGIWKKAGADISSLPVPKLHLHKGLPFNIDLGASLAAVPDSNIRLLGLEARYAIVEGGMTLPALSLRAAITRLSGVSQLDLDTKSVELTASKGFLMLTPYIGVGHVWANVDPNVASLQKVTPTANKLFAGINANLGLVNLAGEVDRTGDNQSVSVKVGFRW
ncbi:MAG: hypothetical protein Q7R66_21630 [Undibacterium sp.]|uniref:hypothetical protein n=1 Tax=Undibacterium sp. TaxID=1914977 RepID=UPI002728F5D8|nr:hypothetical protein [Undibacterium sp.]MDO8654779.1 hypothetical protein [Undibacterium sp.]